MYIQTEDTPNPSTLKFIPGVPVMKSGTAAFASEKDCAKSPLAEKIFAIKEVTGIFFGSNFLSVTKTDSASWDILKTEIIAVIMDHIVAGGEIYVDSDKVVQDSQEEDSEIVKQIKELLEERVRPAVAMDGGDIVFHKFEDGIVFLEMHGACSGCPSSSVTLKNGVESMLKHFIPEIVKVEEV